jgi:hypothetical protein
MRTCSQRGVERRQITHHPLVEIGLVRVDRLRMLNTQVKNGIKKNYRYNLLTCRKLSRRENCFPQWQANGRSPVCFLQGK